MYVGALRGQRRMSNPLVLPSRGLFSLPVTELKGRRKHPTHQLIAGKDQAHKVETMVEK